MPTLRERICRFLCRTPEPTKPETLLTYKKVVSMLKEYDNTRFEVLVNGLGFEDTRVNTFNFEELKNYMEYTQKLAKKKKIKLKGISFIKGVYSSESAHKDDFIGYENLMYMPTAMVNGKEVLVDLINSKVGKIVTFKEMLERYGYEWRYDNVNNYKMKGKQKEVKIVKAMMKEHDELSGTANVTNIAPPYELQ